MQAASQRSSGRSEIRLPYAPEAEMSVLGGLLHDPDAGAVVFGQLADEDFHDPKHRLIFAAMETLYRRGDLIDPVTVSEQLKLSGRVRDSGGMSYIGELLDAVPTAANVEYHARLVRDRATRRRLWQTATGIARDAIEADGEPLEQVLARAEEQVFAVAERGAASAGAPIRKVMHEVMDLMEAGEYSGLPFGFHRIDSLTGGMRPGQLVILAGGTGMGKTSLALNIVANAALEAKKSVAVYSIEMTRAENAARMVASEALADLQAMLRAGEKVHEIPRIMTAMDLLRDAKIHLDDSATRVLDIRARARRIKAEHGLDLVVVDHIHDMQEEGPDRREQLGTIARGLKWMAKELQVPVIACAQLSRKPEERTDHRPVKSDLKESGDIENIADIVLLVYRPEVYHGPVKDGEDITGQAEIIVAKNRNGPLGSVDLYYRAFCTRFEDVTGEPRP